MANGRKANPASPHDRKTARLWWGLCPASLFLIGMGLIQHCFFCKVTSPDQAGAVRFAQQLCTQLSRQPATVVTATCLYATRRIKEADATHEKRGFWETICEAGEEQYILRFYSMTQSIQSVERTASGKAEPGERVTSPEEALWLAMRYAHMLGWTCKRERFIQNHPLACIKRTPVWELLYDASPQQNRSQMIRIQIATNDSKLEYFHDGTGTILHMPGGAAPPDSTTNGVDP